MIKKRFVYYVYGQMYVGWLEDLPEYRTQGETLIELQENLKDIYRDVMEGNIPYACRVGELVVE
jgi:predicted RNase H-like HicB family nuclease